MILCALSLKSLQWSKFCNPPDCSAVGLWGEMHIVTADFCEEHASRGRFPLDIPRRGVLPFPPSRESVLPSMPYVYPALHNPKDFSQILFPRFQGFEMNFP